MGKWLFTWRLRLKQVSSKWTKHVKTWIVWRSSFTTNIMLPFLSQWWFLLDDILRKLIPSRDEVSDKFVQPINKKCTIISTIQMFDYNI